MDIEIDDQLRTALKPLSEEEREGLKTMIGKDGKILMPIVVWETAEGRSIIVDGHHRYKIAEELGIGFKIEKMKFGNRGEAIAWIQNHQANRRNVTKGEAAILRGRKANDHKMTKGENLKKRNENTVGQVERPSDNPKKQMPEIAKEEGVSVATLQRDAARAEIHDEAAKVDPDAAKAVTNMPQSEVDDIKRAADEGSKDNPEFKPSIIAAELNKRTAAPRKQVEKIEGASSELMELVQSGAISPKVAENFVAEVPGEGTQAKIVSKGVDAIKKAASKPREEKPKESVKVTEASVLAFLQDSDAATKARIIGKVFNSSEPEDRKVIFAAQQKTFTETERFKLIDWAREQDSRMESEITPKEIKIISTRSKTELNQKHRVSLVNQLLENPSSQLIVAMKKWAHNQFVGKQSLFVAPTEDEVKAYATTLDKDKYPEANRPKRIRHFLDVHETSGWTYGKDQKPVKDWQARFRLSLSWEMSEGDSNSQPIQYTTTTESVAQQRERIRNEEFDKFGEGALTRNRRLRAEKAESEKQVSS